METVSAWLMRGADVKIASLFEVADFAFMMMSFGALQLLLTECVAGGAKSEFEGFAWDAFDEGLNGPGEAARNGAGE